MKNFNQHSNYKFVLKYGFSLIETNETKLTNLIKNSFLFIFIKAEKNTKKI